MGEISKIKTTTNSEKISEEFTSETIELIKMAVGYEKKIEELRAHNEKLKDILNFTSSELRDAKYYYNDITKKSTKEELTKALDGIYNIIYSVLNKIH